jgi:tight adherence protein B
LDGLWVIYALVFGAALLGIQAVYWLFFRSRQQQKAINRRLALHGELRHPVDALEALRRERGFSNFRNPIFTRANDYLVQTGLKIDYNTLAMCTAAIMVAFVVIFSLAMGFGLLAFILAAVTAIGAVLLFLRRARNRRIARFGEQLPDALDVIVRGVKVGHPFSTAISLVAKEMQDPIGTEFGMASDEITFGLELNTAMENLSRRVGQEDLLFFMTAINIQSKTGGNLAEILERLSRLIRQRIKIRLKIRALTAEGRLSAIFLTIVPFVLFGTINLLAPSFYATVKDHPATVPVLVFAVVLLAIGNLVLRKMVNFRA